MQDQFLTHVFNAPQGLSELISCIKTQRGKVFIFCSSSRETLCKISALLQEHGISTNFAANWEELCSTADIVLMALISIDTSWCFDNKVFISATLVCPHIASSELKRNEKFHDKVLSTVAPVLQDGQTVIHRQYGVGKFMGFHLLTVMDITREFAKLCYANDDKLYIPVEHLNQIKAYQGDNGKEAKLDNLKSRTWQQRCSRTKDKIKAIAMHIIDLAARRQSLDANIYALEPRNTLVNEMVASFAFTETKDQSRAIEEVYTDLGSGKPMDRLICGDVGFGKTEVALRALFLVICGKLNNHSYGQVVLLCPTTYLTRQHYQNFCERLKDFDINIAQLSRLSTRDEVRHTKAGLMSGAIDVVVATHAILGSDIGFKRLDLIICDEEQLFGVSQKEQLKRAFPVAHCLALSATPIPRTLEAALHGIRDVSTIMTPPPERVLIQGEIITMNAAEIIDIIAREKRRGGYVICVTPRIAYIQSLLEFMATIMPDLRLTVLHGKLSSEVVERALKDLHDGVYDMVIATVIIAVGMDFSKSNTIIIHRAEMFGLAQLYQIRGRVGRRDQQAYCYFLVEEHVINDPSKSQHLEILRNIKSLGSGLSLAHMDLQLRGGGNILGKEQSGLMADIGPDLYYQMLEDAIKHLQLAPEGDYFIPEVDIGVSIYIPQDYIADPLKRVDLYRKIASIANLAALEDLHLYMVEHFGVIPPSLDALFIVIKIRHYCLERKIAAVNITGRRVVIKPLSGKVIDTAQLIDLLTRDSNIILRANNTIAVNITEDELDTLDSLPMFLHAFNKLKGAWLLS